MADSASGMASGESMGQPGTTDSDEVKIEQIDDDEDVDPKDPKMLPPEREQWGSKVAYFLTLVGYAVGFGNIWRFPYQMRENGGLVFLVPYCIMLGLLGIPIFFLELAVGQRRRKGVIYAWKEISPALGGIGISCGCLCFLVGLYYNTLIAYCLSYLIDSFWNPLPWTNCKTAAASYQNASYEQECKVQLSDRATKYYWFRGTLKVSDSYGHPGNYNWWLCLYLFIGWTTIYGILMKGTQSVGYVVYFTAVFPYVVLLAFFVANCVIEPAKAWLGAYRLLKPDWHALYRPITWLKAGSQIFFSLNLAEGCLVIFASYSPTRNNCYKDAIHISIINCSTSIFAALVVFPMIGALGHRKYEECFKAMAKYFPTSLLSNASTLGKKYDIYFLTQATTWDNVSDKHPIRIMYRYDEFKDYDQGPYTEYSHEALETIKEAEDWNRTYVESLNKPMELEEHLWNCSIGQEATASGGGTGFVFMGFTEAVKHMQGSNFWCFLFFFMLLTLGIDSAFGTVEGVIASLQDLTHIRRSYATLIVCAVMMFIAILLFPFGWGIYILDLMDQWAANWTYLVIAVFECIAVAWSYGLAKISYDVLLMTGSKPNLYMLLCWKYIAPSIIITLLIASIGQFIWDTVKEGGFMYIAFQPLHPSSEDGDLKLPMPPLVLCLGLGMMFVCVMWVPINYLLQRKGWNLLKDEALADFPEEELREERNIHEVKTEAEHFTNAERAIMGQRSLMSLQEHRDSIARIQMDEGGGGGQKRVSSSSRMSVASRK